MSDVPRFDCFDDGMREGYNESWVRSSDYDALRAERDALAKENAALRALIAECGEQVFANRKRLELDIANAAKFPTHTATVRACTVERDACDALLARIDATLGEA